MDQASTMYGPVQPILTSWLFQVFGVSNLPGKLLSLVASVCVIGLVLAFTARRDLRAWAIGAALLFACNHNVGFYFVEARPDMIAILLGLLALFLFREWERRRRLWALLVSLAFFVLAFLAKQPLAAAALVPLVAEASHGAGRSRGRIVRLGTAALPLVAVVLAIACLRGISPMAYFYMVTLPAQYHVHLLGAWHSGFELLLMYASLLVVGFDLAAYPARQDPQTRWWGAAVGVFLVAGIVAMAKDGGWWNSLLPCFIASAGLVTLHLPRAFAVLDNPTLRIGRRVVVSTVLALMLITFAVRHPGEALNAFRGVITVQGDAHYQQVVALARELRGRVLCPEDPTIPLLARGDITRSVFLEMDVTRWPSHLPAYVDDEIAAARYVIQVKGPLERLLTDEWLIRLGFAPVNEDRLEGSVYHLWRKRTG
jgi:4-amino-4-deoxy-L-arabinose transferase-like glycosyltransferase